MSRDYSMLRWLRKVILLVSFGALILGVSQSRAQQEPKVGSAATAISDGFDYPISDAFRPTREQGDADGWYVTNYFNHYLDDPPCTAHYHPGDDWNRNDGNDAGKPVKAVSNGKVEAIRDLQNANHQPLGQGIVISHILPDNSTVYSVYIHVNANSSLAPGTPVSRGDPIATIASIAGFGPHLHFEIRTSMNPQGDWYPGDDGCGYYDSQAKVLSSGFVDPVTFVDQHRSRYEGYLDNVGCSTIDGWAWDNTQPNTAVSVDVYDGANKILSAIPADQLRPDLVGLYGNGRHGFSIPTPQILKNGEQHTVWVKITGPDHNLSFSPKTVTCGYVGYLDVADCNVIRGWAADTNRPNTSFNVSIYDGPNLLTTVLANQSRSDVGAILGDNGLHGFNIPTPAVLKTGSHNVSVKFEATAIGLPASPKTISCDPSQTDYAGYLDVADCNVIRGWAADRNRLNTSINVGIYDGGSLIATVLASQSRSDVGEVLGDNGLHGFHIPTPASLKDGQAHSLSVKFESSTTNLPNGTRSINCSGGADYTGYLDVADCNVIRGWAADRNRLNTSINVGIYDGGNLITTVLASQSRSDVGNFLGDNGLHGFNIPTPSVFKNNQAHSLSVKYESSATGLTNGTRSITCSGGVDYTGYVDVADCNVIRGWAADRNRLNTSINVSIYDGANLVTTVPASQLRSDVGSVLGDNGLHGFNIATPTSLKNGQAHSVRVRFESSVTDLSNSPASLSCSSTDYIGYVDVADCNVIRGWAADKNRLNQSINVGIYDNNILLTTVLASQSRSDVGNVLGDNGLHGFNIATPASLKNGQNHSVHVKFESSATELNASPQPLTCVNNPTVSSISPGNPPRKDTDQNVTVNGSGFQQNLTVTLFFPTGGSTLLSGSQIQNVNSNSFRLVVTLNLVGTYGIRVNNPDGGQSSTFQFQTLKITSISPSSPAVNNSDQSVIVNGSGFQPNLTVTVFFPGGGNGTLSGSQIVYSNSGRFTMIVTLNQLGQYNIRVNNPDSAQSEMFSFNTH